MGGYDISIIDSSSSQATIEMRWKHFKNSA